MEREVLRRPPGMAYLFETIALSIHKENKSIERRYLGCPGHFPLSLSLIRLSSSSGLSYMILLRKNDWGWRMKAILCNFDDNKDIKLWFGQSNLAVVYCRHTNTSDCHVGRSSRVESDVHTTFQQPQATTFVCRALTMQAYG